MNYTQEIAKSTKDPNILKEILKKGKNNAISWNAARNPYCPKELLTEILERGNNDDISTSAASNPNCSTDILKEILKRENDDSVSCCAASNPNCPIELLTKILKRGNDDAVSWYASKNPNCPTYSIINWMYSTGKIEKENPNKHIIEYEYKQDDFQDLKNLLN